MQTLHCNNCSYPRRISQTFIQIVRFILLRRQARKFKAILNIYFFDKIANGLAKMHFTNYLNININLIYNIRTSELSNAWSFGKITEKCKNKFFSLSCVSKLTIFRKILNISNILTLC